MNNNYLYLSDWVIKHSSIDNNNNNNNDNNNNKIIFKTY